MTIMDFYLTFTDSTIFEIFKGDSRVYVGHLANAPLFMMDLVVLEAHVKNDSVILSCG